MLVDSGGLTHIYLQEGWVDVAPANPVRSERKQPQWDVYGSSSLPLSPDIYILLKMIASYPWAFAFFGVTCIFESVTLVQGKG